MPTSQPARRESASVDRERPVLVFDGDCALCHRSVRMVLLHERAPWVLFAAMRSETGRALFRGLEMPAESIDSMVFFEDRHTYLRSEAVVRLARHLRAPWSWLRFLGVVPRSLRDCLYDALARRRIRWFGTATANCPVPDGELRRRFLP